LVLVVGLVEAGQVVLPGYPVGAGYDVEGRFEVKMNRIAQIEAVDLFA